MKTTRNQLSFRKDLSRQNILFDEYFAEHQEVEIVACNYDGHGTALCRGDGALAEINLAHVKRIIFGASKEAVETFLTGIFNPEAETEDITRQDDAPVFRLPELQKMKRYEAGNLAKKTLKEFKEHGPDHLRYFLLDEEED